MPFPWHQECIVAERLMGEKLASVLNNHIDTEASPQLRDTPLSALPISQLANDASCRLIMVGRSFLLIWGLQC